MTQLYQNIKIRLSEIEILAKKKNWDIIETLKIEEPASKNEILEIEKKIRKKLPCEYKEILMNFSKKVSLSYHLDIEAPEEFKEVFSGEIFWDINKIIDLTKLYTEWIEASIDPEYNDKQAIIITKKYGLNSTPFMSVPNGDLIIINDITNEVFYLDHEGGEMHGKRLGKSFFNFLDIWTQIGIIGSEGWQFEAIYDFENNKLLPIDNEKVQRWIDWLKK